MVWVDNVGYNPNCLTDITRHQTKKEIKVQDKDEYRRNVMINSQFVKLKRRFTVNHMCGRRAWLLMFLVLMAGCARWPSPTSSIQSADKGPTGECVVFFERLDQAIVAADAVDASVFRIPGYPYLRTNRFLASLAPDTDTDDRFDTWCNRLQAQDRMARRVEIDNLSDTMLNSIAAGLDRQSLAQRIDECGNRLRRNDFESRHQRDAFRHKMAAPDEYIASRRWLGLYPLMRPFISQGVRTWHGEARQDRMDAAHTARGVPSYCYGPSSVGDIDMARHIIQNVDVDALDIPHYTPEQQRKLFRALAPVWEIRTATEADRIGSPAWDHAGRLSILTDQPKTYERLSYTHFAGDILTQLNYVIWFPGRPKTGPFDIYGGWLDGIILRITLDRTGRPLLYETIHNCGCYYKAFLTDRINARESIDYDEPPLIFKMQTSGDNRGRLAVIVSPADHYVLDLCYPDPSHELDLIHYDLLPYDLLKRLPVPGGGHRSMFDRYGLVPGSERLERFILWPSGVHSPGAMRQWGRHAVTLIGKRHFDDPDFMDRAFVEQ